MTALKVLFGAVTADCELCFVVATSLDSTWDHALRDQFRDVTTLKVATAQDRQPLDPGHIYILPQGQLMTVEHGAFRLDDSIARDDSHGRIDRFFRSLAADQGDRAVAIVLSGAGTEGAIGAHEIKAAGGLAIAQTPESTAEPEMPNRAIAIGAVDLILRPERMLPALLVFAARPSNDLPIDRPASFREAPALDALQRAIQDRDLLDHVEPAAGVAASADPIPVSYRAMPHRYDTHVGGSATLERSSLAGDPLSPEVVRLEAELRRSHEELKSAHETIGALREQLKSTNEDLLFVRPDVVTVLLDKDVRIRRFTSAAARVLGVTDSDVGRRIDDVVTPLVDVDLGDCAREVLDTGTPVERSVNVEDGRKFTLRLLACRRDDDETPLGVLMALVDVTALTARERHFRLAYDTLQRSNDVLERRVTERTRWLGLLHKVTRAIGDAPSWDEGLNGALKHICEHEHWQLGYVYVPDADAPDTVVHAISCVRAATVLPFHRASEHQRYRSGQGFPGRVYADGAPVWLTTPDELQRCLPIRAEVARAVGLKTAVAIPVRFGSEVIAVLELFSTEVHVPSDPLVDLMHVVSDQIGNVVERERRNVQMEARIWREQQDLLHTLHDSLGQTLTGLGLMAAALRKRLVGSDAAIADTSRQIALHAESALGEIRQLAKGLFPTDLDADGLLAALHQLAATTQAVNKVRVRVQEGSACTLRDHRIATNLYRIAQEAVTNGVKHANAQTITIRVQTNSGLTTLRVWDDGRGIKDVSAHVTGVGLRIMNYRARSIGATLTVAAQEQGGTMVTCVVREALHSPMRTPGYAS